MANLKDIRMRIDSTKNTQQITKAMKLVSAAKLRKAQHNITNMRPYAMALKQVICNIAATQKVSHPLMTKKESVKNVLLVVLTSDRGLCGSFNSSINKFADRYIADNSSKYEKIDFIFVGKRGADFFARKQIKGLENITKLEKDISFDLAHGVAEKLINHFLGGSYDEIRLIYNEFKSAISQKVVCETLLPIELDKSSFEGTKFSPDMIFDPAPELIIEELLKKNFNLQVYRAMSESVASEHGARMTAMENASNNARDMINKLTLTYNKLRQEKITTELTEIVSGAESLKG
jgi:F-type H+-transporting ATPase subunit gamma